NSCYFILTESKSQCTSQVADGFASEVAFWKRARSAISQPELVCIQYDASMRHKVTLLPGEGIGPEVSRAVRGILEAAGVQIDWEEIEARAAESSGSVKPNGGSVLNQTAVDSVRRNAVALKGPMATAVAGGAPSVNVALRKTLDLYANLRPVRNLPGLKSRFENVDV